MILIPPVVIVTVTVVRLTMSGPDLLLHPGRTQRSSCRNDLMSAVGLCLSVTIPWLKLRNYSAAGAQSADYYRISESAVEATLKIGTGTGTGTGTGIDTGGDDDFCFFLSMNDDRAQTPPFLFFPFLFPLFLFPTLTRTKQEEPRLVER